MKIIMFIFKYNGFVGNNGATQHEISEATGISRSRICCDLRELGMWYNDYVEHEGRPKRYSLNRLGNEVATNERVLSIHNRTRSRHLG